MQNGYFAFIGLYSPLGLTELHSHTVLRSAAIRMPPFNRAEEKTWQITAEHTLVLKSFVIFNAQQRKKTLVFRSLIRCQHRDSFLQSCLPERCSAANGLLHCEWDLVPQFAAAMVLGEPPGLLCPGQGGSGAKASGHKGEVCFSQLLYS